MRADRHVARSSRSSRAGAPDDASRCTRAQKKIYPRAVQRLVRRAGAGRCVWLTQLVFYGLPWLEWNGRQAVLFDLAARALLHLRPGAVSAGLHLPHGAAGHQRARAVPLHRRGRAPVVRLRLPADRVHRDLPVGRAQDRGRPQRAHAARRARRGRSTSCCARGGKHARLARASALWTGFTFVGYFTPIRELGAEVAARSRSGPGRAFWVLFYGFATYGNAGFMREQVCKYMCPYARFQSAMFDRDTLIISYDAARGEPRGARARKARPARARPGRLHRLHAVRAGLPDRHRHPQGPAVRVHRLRRLHRRLRQRDGQDGLPARA